MLSLDTPNDVQSVANTHRIFKRLAKALIRLRVCAGCSDALLVAHTTLLEISCRGSVIKIYVISTYLLESLWSLAERQYLAAQEIYTTVYSGPIPSVKGTSEAEHCRSGCIQ